MVAADGSNDGGHSNQVERDLATEWASWDRLPKECRDLLIECKYEFSATDAFAVWQDCEEASFSRWEALSNFKYCIRRNVEQMDRDAIVQRDAMLADLAATLSGRILNTNTP